MEILACSRRTCGVEMYQVKISMSCYLLQKKKQITFALAHILGPINSMFHLPLSSQAHSQFLILQEVIESVSTSIEQDKWSYIWNNSEFSVKKAYKQLSGHSNVHQVYKWLWASSCQCKHKVFFWLIIKDRISTRALLIRKIFHLQDYSCVLCNNSVDESIIHLLLECPFAIQCWNLVNIQIDQDLNPFQLLHSFREQLAVPFFMEIIILLSWTIWKLRNDFIYRGVNPTIQATNLNFKEEWRLLLLKAKKSYSPFIDQWSTSLA